MWLAVALSLVSVACGDDDRAPPLKGNGGSGGNGGDGGAQPTDTRQTISGNIVWTVTFDAVAKSAGATDCSYNRAYVGVEDMSRPWLCPSCDVMFRADVQIVDGDACYDQVSEIEAPEVEWIGWAGDVFMRSAGLPMTAQGTVAIDAQNVTSSNAAMDLEVPVGGTVDFAIGGDFALDVEPGDARHGYDHAPSSYECGWPTSNAPEYAGDYVLAVGQTVPDGLFHDRCDQLVRLHDFEGKYLVIDMSAADCPPCQQWASQEDDFVVSMAGLGKDTAVITLLAPSLADPLGDTSQVLIDNWTSTYDLSSPVLADRAWGVSMFLPAIGETMGYPSWAVVAPDLTVIAFGTGFGTFAAFEQIILAN